MTAPKKTKTAAKKRHTKAAAKKRLTNAAAVMHHSYSPHPNEFDVDLRLFTDMAQLVKLLNPLLQDAIKAAEEVKRYPLRIHPYHNITYCKH